MLKFEQSRFAYITQTVFGKEITRVCCPNKDCEQKLPRDFFKSDATVISIVGSSGVGKTYYAVTLIDLLRRNRILHRLGIAGDIINEGVEITNHIEGLLRQREQGAVLSSTAVDKSNLTWVIQISIRKGNRSRYLYLSFFDNGGEGFKTVTNLLNTNSNILQADGLIFLFSPRELPDIFSDEIAAYNIKFPKSGVAAPNANNYATIFDTLNSVIEAFRLLNNKPSTKWYDEIMDCLVDKSKIKIPVALCISWYDVIQHKFKNKIPSDMDETKMSAIIQDKQIKYEVIQSYSDEIKELLYNEETGNIRLENIIETSLNNYLYFAIQTIQEEEDGSRNSPKSKGCLLPVLWMLKQLKIIDL
jgi:ABC-type dipeptide/oligopeptide/nickel transport system ATPase component